MGLIDLFALVLIGLVAYANMGEGIYGSLVVLTLSIIAGVIAFNFYEPIAVFLGDRHIPWADFDLYADGVLFLLLYGGSLLGLRALFDGFLTERIRFPVNIDRVGAIAIGTVVGIIAVGALLVACQMLPLNKDFLGYKKERAVLLVSPDATFLTLMHHLSVNVLEPIDGNQMDKPHKYRDHYFRLRWPLGDTAPEEPPSSSPSSSPSPSPT